jgi:WD40 repeat protein
VDATWNGTGAALVWDVARTVPHSRLTGHTAVIAAAAWDPESGRFVTASRDGTARLWDPELDASRHHRCASGYEITTAEWHPTDPTRAVIACSDGTVTIWDPSGQGKLGPHEIFGDERPPPLAYAAWSPDGRWLAAARAGDGRLRVLAVPPSGSDAWLDRLDHTGAPGGPRQMAEQQCDMVAWSPDSRYLAVMHYERLEVWDVGDGGAAPRLIAELPPSYGGGEALRLSALAWHPRLPRLAVARWTMDEQTVRVLDVPSAPTNDWQPSFQLMHGEGVWSLAFTHDGAQLVTGANDKLVRVFDLPATPGASVATLQPSFRVQMNDQVLAVACSPKDGLFAAGDSQGTVAIFDASEKPSALGDSLIASPEAGNAAIHDLSWSRDGTWVVAASESALLWQREPGPVREGMFVLAARVGGREDRTASVALAPDGAAMITVNEAGIARAEPVSRASLLAAVGTRLHRRTMTDDEWQRYMGALPAQPSWPRPADDPPLPPASLTPASAASPAAAADA